MSLRPRRVSAPAILIAVLASALVCAAGAAAETRTGESTTSLPIGSPTPETTLVKGAGSYDTGGSMSFTFTTAAPPLETVEEEPNESMAAVGLLVTQQCSANFIFSGQEPTPPIALIQTTYGEPTAKGIALFEPKGPEVPLGEATKVISGATTTLSLASGLIAEKPFNCAIVETLGTNTEGGAGMSVMTFPISVPPPPPAPPAPTPTPPAPTPAPAPVAPALSIAKQKPVKLAVGKWKTVRVKVTNTGGTATGRGSLRVKAPKGVSIKPERQQLPVLTPGGSWTVSVRVELTEKAKKKSTLALTAAAPGATGAAGSLVLKLKQ